MSCAVPTSEAVGEFFGSLVGREIRVDEAGPFSLESETLTATAIYTVETGSVGALCLCDLLLACHAGAAFSFIPAEEVQKKLEHGKVSQELYDTVLEMFRMLANLFNKPDAPEVSFHTMGVTPAPAPEFLADVINRAQVRLDLDVEIPEYGAGRLSFLAT